MADTDRQADRYVRALNAPSRATESVRQGEARAVW